MKVIVHLDIIDEQRSELSLLLHPKSPNRLATRQEFTDVCVQAIADIGKPVMKAERYVPFDEDQEMYFGKSVTLSPERKAEEAGKARIMAGLLEDMPITVGPQVTLTDAPKELPAITVPVEAGEELYGLRQLIHHVNCAMFSIAHALRMAKEFAHPDSHATITRLDDDLQGLRQNLAAEHDEQIPEREGAGWSDSQ